MNIKVYVAVKANFNEDGTLIPFELTWEDGRRYTIDRVVDIRQAAAMKAGGQGDRYTIEYLLKNPQIDAPYKTVTNFKKDFLELMKQLNNIPANAIHYNLISLIKEARISAIITTNYDVIIERVLDPNFDYFKDVTKTEKPHNPKPVKVYGVDIYHAHGVLADVKTVCLGYNHYATILACLRGEIAKKQTNLDNSLAIRQLLTGQITEPILKWSELFFTSNIAFIGFALDTCEIDIWWLLTYRAYLYCGNFFQMRGLINNKIVFYDLVICPFDSIDFDTKSNLLVDCISDKKKRLYDLLKCYHVEINLQPLFQGEDYSDGYLRIIKSINQYGIRGNQ